jgi:transcriptional regulator with XRE-family HTH domain
MSAIELSQFLREARRRAGLSQEALAGRINTAQSVVARVESGRSCPTIATLQRMLGAAGFELSLELTPVTRSDALVDAYKTGVDRSLLRESLRRTPEQRMRALASLARLADEAARAGREARRRTPSRRGR